MAQNTTVKEEITANELLAREAQATAAEESTVVETTEKDMFTPENLSDTLPIMGKGMLGIFLVTAIIVATITVLDRTTKIKFKKKKDSDSNK